MTWHKTSHHIASNDVTITWPDPATDAKTSKHFTSKHKTSPPWNGRRLVHSKEMIWASRWSVALRTFYRQMLSVLYYIVLFLLETSAPGLSGHYWYIHIYFTFFTFFCVKKTAIKNKESWKDGKCLINQSFWHLWGGVTCLIVHMLWERCWLLPFKNHGGHLWFSSKKKWHHGHHGHRKKKHDTSYPPFVVSWTCWAESLFAHTAG